MPSTYSSALAVTLMANGEESATWGTITNTNIGTLLEQAIVGYGSVPIADTNTTITMTQGASAAARCAVLNVTGALTANRNLVVPTITKSYVIQNNTTGGFSVVVKTSAGSGITVPAGQTRLVYANGTNVVEGINSTGNLAVNGTLIPTGAVTIASGTATLTSATITNLTVTGTASLPAAPSSSVTITGGTINSTPIGGTTPAAGAFTTLSASSTVSGAGFTARFATPGPIGSTSASTGAFTTIAASGTFTGATITGTNITGSGTVQGVSVKATSSFVFPDLTTMTSAGLPLSGGALTGFLRVGQNTTTTPGVLNDTVGMGLSSVGILCLGSTASSSTAVLNINSSTDGYYAAKFSSGGGLATGYIVVSTSSTAYGSASDYRMKFGNVRLSDAMERVNQLKPYFHKWISSPNGNPVMGFYAHEAAEVVPQAVHGQKDEVDDRGTIVPQSIDYGRFTPLLTAAIQELDERMRKLEAR